MTRSGARHSLGCRRSVQRPAALHASRRRGVA